MSYISIWGVNYSDLRRSGFRPLVDQAWAGVSSQKELAAATERAARMGLTTAVPFTREDLHTRFRYSFDLTPLADAEFDFRWSLVSTGRIDIHFAFDNSRHWRNLSLGMRTAVGFFPDEAAATAWKLTIG